ncbi:zinc finger MYND domain-containing protein 11-like protein [Dinothrombium tinctorium]|uniref:Zinc finger MYND domain-containing protein 11-like protein n=1 Tax=Dinothrombium tinctorium TaxID=1965070 RepID=A0A443RQY4_9ACAR|nr:zinc finger MYND domain-containing protein 11-like protein [Dinothrombium tinctorium]
MKSVLNVNEFTKHSFFNGRCSSPWVVVEIWKSIQKLQEDKKSSTKSALISCLLKRVQIDEKQIDEEIKKSLKDELIVKNNDVYKIPENCSEKNPDHDWYCFTCHLGGEVISCTNCWRVYHRLCMEDNDESGLCTPCKLLSQPCEKIRGKEPSAEELRKMLNIIYKRISEETSSIISLNFSENSENGTNKLTSSLIEKLLFKHKMNFIEVRRKIEAHEYKKIIDFEIDCKTILHNVFVLFGNDSGYANSALKMFKTCCEEANFIRDCIDCYLYFYERATDTNWFCYTCSPPHELVLAKVKGFSHWPAKVIRSDIDQYYVWFFGGKHERAFVKLERILPATAKLPPPRFAPLVRAYEEFDRHKQMLINEGISFTSLIPYQTNKRVVEKKVPSLSSRSGSAIVRLRGGKRKPYKLKRKTNSRFIPSFETASVITHRCQDFEVDLTSSTFDESSLQEGSNVDKQSLPPKKRVTVAMQQMQQHSESVDQEQSPDLVKSDIHSKLQTCNNNETLLNNNDSSPKRRLRLKKEIIAVRRSSRPKAVAKRFIDYVSDDEQPRSKPKKPRTIIVPGKRPRGRPRKNPLPTESQKHNRNEAKDAEKIIEHQSTYKPIQPVLRELTHSYDDTSSERNDLRYSVFKANLNGIDQHQESCDNLKIVFKREIITNDEEDSVPINDSQFTISEITQNSITNSDETNERPLNSSEPISSEPPNGLPEQENQAQANKLLEERKKHELQIQEYENKIRDLKERIDNMTAQHKREINEVKKKQWCFVCLKEAIYYCCWNTSYCSTECQDRHWRIAHKAVCRRKQAKAN